MGAWGSKNFDNDTAMDWLGEFMEQPTIEEMEEVFESILEEEEYLDADLGSVGLACAEILLELLEPGDNENIPTDFDVKSLKLTVPKQLIVLALSSIHKILSLEEESELRELWEESDEMEEWLSVQNQLIERLSKHL